MRAPLSVIIPTLNAGESLPGCAAALFEGLEAGLIREVVVSDGGSTDRTRTVAAELGAVWVQGAASRGGQLRRGIAASEGEWLLILHADTQLSPGWAEVALAHLVTGEAGYFRLSFARGGWRARTVAGWANARSRYAGLPFGDQGLILPRRLYDQVGGYPDQPLLEDVALVRALKGRLHPLDAVAVTSPDRYEAGGWVRRGTRNLAVLTRYLLGADPEALARSYRRR
ncbi:TIGR04283 family arsenosugar biosynthesis glycosyltransferase [Pseudooceanicola sp.]|jgi:rSAM/selenodomain-associated transferase 2|uniref:TIGR04283 family arsenosugar biosynthesis glycosyltransferase n=1 Tax=Pseudooceanicola sp. TaxID=1914328 RepID=UPI004059929A